MRNPIYRIAAILSFALFAASASAGSFVWGADKGLAIDGYDPVAYFTDGKPEKGRPEFTADWAGTTWRFVSAEHRDRFKQTPEKYAPQYGGYCAYAMASGTLAAGNGKRWRLVNDKLYLNNNWLAQKLWEKDIPGKISEADKQYPPVKAKLEAGS
jgi:YHS domain-containing protein